MGQLANGMKECPHCAEPILAAAKKCKHCGERLDDPPAENPLRQQDADPAADLFAATQPAPRPAPGPSMAVAAGGPVIMINNSQSMAGGVGAYCRRCRRMTPVRPGQINHLLHFFLSFLLLGFWLFVWLALAIFGGKPRCAICNTKV